LDDASFSVLQRINLEHFESMTAAIPAFPVPSHTRAYTVPGVSKICIPKPRLLVKRAQAVPIDYNKRARRF
jgi:hypothetical protein